MNLDDVIHEEGRARLEEFKPVPLQAFEVWVFEVRPDADEEYMKLNRVQSGRAEWQQSRIPDEHRAPRIGPWLDAQAVFKHARHLNQGPSAVVGGLRLLFQKWTKQDGILDSTVPIMPFFESDFDKIMDKLCLPRSFPLDFAGCQQIPAEIKKISTRHGERLGLL